MVYIKNCLWTTDAENSEPKVYHNVSRCSHSH